MKILMVCLGNICRSPLAEGILKAKLSTDFTVDSAGTIDMHEGENPDYRSIEIAQKYNIDISEQKSRPFTYEDFQNFDRIYCMDKNNLADVLALARTDNDRNKVSLLGENLEVPDPYWGTMKDFDEVFQLLENASNQIAKDLKTKKKGEKAANF
ncbi:low molecular weight phosphotyrosine protein phosphatase [Chryseobacterium sp. H3056]|uniref:protein-tyrosine-phosphatase n=1 Tax=Kaistella daneshvariae TaxID=2487074 RepID=A0A3N0WW97_9FLAO|nr:low molecular weight protein-tyrosine-phosphatase [Kaistella daneshvariae]ROI09357.1 low molecular weight phosphotyrosine protein phosphatase [Kaistella daneshvariae]